MGSFTLGPQPSSFSVNLPTDADFTGAIRCTGGPLDPDSSIELRFVHKTGEVVWPAIHDPDDDHRAFWNVDELDVGALIALKPDKCRLHYVLGEADLLWATCSRVRNV